MAVELNPNLSFTLTELDAGGFDSALPNGSPIAQPPAGALTDVARRFTVARSFSGTPGVQTSLESDGFDSDDNRTFYSTEQAYSGSTSAKSTILVSDAEEFGGNGGTWEFGGVVSFPQELYEGDEFFARYRIFMPVGFDPYTSGGGGRVKFTRIKTLTSSGANGGLIDTYWNYPNKPETYSHIVEAYQVWNNYGDSTLYPHIFGQWVTFNQHTVLSADGSIGRMRVWRENDLILNAAGPTFGSALDRATKFYLFTYWNGTPSQDQSLYIDDLVITSDRDQVATHSPSGLPWVGI